MPAGNFYLALSTYLHFGSGFGVDLLCPFTETVLRPGLPFVRFGAHFTLGAIIGLLSHEKVFLDLYYCKVYYSKH